MLLKLPFHYISVSACTLDVVMYDFLRGKTQQRTALGEMRCLPEFTSIAPFSPLDYKGAAPN